MSSNNFSFTITQPFLGAPLQFTPALGSQELEQLVDAYVLGNASKQEKLSEVTIDFYNHATVDLNTGALVKTYNVFAAFEQSPTESQSSFSPSMYTPSPASTNFGDSGYGSFSMSMTPPARRGGSNKVAKKPAKKDKVTEARLPGFSIMTKDGIDVTSSAGRGTKTKEQREHAHLMRIMKACDACKKKKIRCDPSHRRQSNEMSRTPTASTAQTSSSSSSKSSSNRRVNPSPAASVPSFSHESTFASQSTAASFGAIDDFVLFPEDGSSWNPADMSLPEDVDLSQFNFDINLDIPMDSSDFDFSAFDPMQPMDFNQNSYLPSNAHGLDQWAGLPVSHSRPHPSASTQDSGQLDINSADSWIHTLPDPVTNNGTHPSFSSQDSTPSSLFSTTNVSPQTIGTVSDEIWPDGPGDSPSPSQFFGRVQQPRSERSPMQGEAASNVRQQTLDQSPTDGGSMSPYSHQAQRSLSGGSPADSSTQSPAAWSGSRSQANSRTSLQTDDLQYWTESTHHTRRGRESPAAALARRQLTTSRSNIEDNTADRTLRSDGQSIRTQAGLPNVDRIVAHSPDSRNSPPRPPMSSLGFSNDVYGLANTCTLVSESLRAVKQGPAECLSLAGDLQRLRTVLVQYRSEAVNANAESDGDTGRDTATHINAFGQRLQDLSARIRQSQVQDVPLDERYLRQSQSQTRLLLRSICARINSLQTLNTGASSPGGDHYDPLTSGRNLQLFASPFEDRDRYSHVLASSGVESTFDDHLNAQDSRSTLPRPDSHEVRLQEDEARYSLAFYKDAYDGAFAPGVESGAVTAVQSRPTYSALLKPAFANSNWDNSEYHLTSDTERSLDAQEVHQASAGPNSGVRIDANGHVCAADRQQEIAECTQQERVSRSQLAVPVDPHVSSLHYAGRSREQSQSLETVVAAPTLDTVLHYTKVVIMASLASIFVASITRSSAISVTSTLPLFIPLSALLLSNPQHLQLAVPIYLALVALLSTGLLENFKSTCQEWTSGTSLASIARLVLCAAIVAQPPSLNALATMVSLLGGASNECCGAGADLDPLSSSSQRNSDADMSRPDSKRPQWLAAMDRLTAVSA